MRVTKELTAGTLLENGCGIVQLTSDYLPDYHGYEYVDCEIDEDGNIYVPDGAYSGLLDLRDLTNREVI